MTKAIFVLINVVKSIKIKKINIGNNSKIINKLALIPSPTYNVSIS